MSVMLLKVTFEPQDGFAWNVKLGVYVVKPEKRGFMQTWQPLLAQEMNLSKCLFPLLFVMVPLVSQAQPQAPGSTLYDPQGRAIPHDGIREAEAPPTPAKPAKQAKQTKASSKKSTASPAAEVKPAKSGKKSSSTKAASKSSVKTSSKAASKTAAKPTTKKSTKKKPAP